MSGTAEVGRLAPGILRAAFGTGGGSGGGSGGRSVAEVTRLAGGSKKGVYRIGCSDDFSAILYVWSADEDYWPADALAADAVADAGAGADGAAVFGHASGLGLFSAAAQRLTAAGVRVPEVYLTDRSQTLYPADIAVVEDVRGGTLEELLCRDPGAATAVMERLGSMLRGLWGQRATRVGRVVDVDGADLVAADGAAAAAGSAAVAGGGGLRPAPESIVLDRALLHLTRSADRVPAVARVRASLDETLRARAALVAPRAECGLIHGELGPDHVSLDDRGEPVVVDIEGAMYFDVEWEHVFLRLRFGRHYDWLRVSGLDERRMSLYALALDLSLVEGPLRLLDGGYPDREEMLAIAGNAVDRVLLAAAP